MLELVTVAVIAHPFVKATYELEGDGPLSLFAYDALSRLEKERTVVYLQNFSYPNILAVCNRLAQEASLRNPVDLVDVKRQEYIAKCKTVAQSGFDYFKSRILDGMRDLVELFRATRLANPVRMSELHVHPATVRLLLNERRSLSSQHGSF
jgi:hypothetical protein